MAFIPVVDVALVEMRMLLDDQKIENTLYVHDDTSWNVTSLTTLANLMKDWWEENYANLVSSAVTLREVAVTDLSTDTAPQVVISGDALAGLGSTPAPNNVAYCVSFRTTRRGRGGRGRNYISGIPNDQIVNVNEVDPDYAAACIAAYSVLLASFFAAGQQWGIAHRFADGAPLLEGEFIEINSVTTVDLVLDSQRRRLPGRGQ